MTNPYHRKKVAELREECRRQGLSTAGRRWEMIERLTKALNKRKRSSPETETARKAIKTSANEIAMLKEINETFDKYQDPENGDEITDDGIVQLCADLGIDPQEAVVLVLSFHMKAAQMCLYTREEFRTGMKHLECRNISQLKSKIGNLQAQLKDDNMFRQVYLYSFDFGKESDQRSLVVDVALALWQLLLPGKFELLDKWIDYVSKNHSKTITRDVWKQTLEFAGQVDADFSNYDENGAWPVLLDDFVAHMKGES